MQECHDSRKGFIQGNEKEKRLPTPFRMLASITRLTTRENGGVKGTSDFTPHLYSLQARKGEERMLPAEGWLLLVSLSYLVPAKMSFMRMMGAQ